MVIATQNPIEHEGTFPLPVSQLDRFLLRIEIGYPDVESEVEMLETHGVSEPLESLGPVATPEDVISLASRVRAVHVSPLIQRYIVQIANTTPSTRRSCLGCPRGQRWRCSGPHGPRAVLEGRDFVAPDDVKAMAPSVISHRLELRPAAGRGRSPVKEVLDEVLGRVPVPDPPTGRR